MFKRKKFLIGGIILFLAIGYLAYTGFAGSATYYYTVSELIALESSSNDQTVRVNGQVAPGSVQYESQGRVLKFNVTDGTQTLPVIYQGVVPDTFKVGNEVVVEGQLSSDGIFRAQVLMPKCPSRYVPKET